MTKNMSKNKLLKKNLTKKKVLKKNFTKKKKHFMSGGGRWEELERRQRAARQFASNQTARQQEVERNRFRRKPPPIYSEKSATSRQHESPYSPSHQNPNNVENNREAYKRREESMFADFYKSIDDNNNNKIPKPIINFVKQLTKYETDIKNNPITKLELNYPDYEKTHSSIDSSMNFDMMLHKSILKTLNFLISEKVDSLKTITLNNWDNKIVDGIRDYSDDYFHDLLNKIYEFRILNKDLTEINITNNKNNIDLILRIFGPVNDENKSNLIKVNISGNTFFGMFTFKENMNYLKNIIINNKNLKELYLKNITYFNYDSLKSEKITDEYVKILCEALNNNNTNLVTLDLSENHITNKGAKYLVDALKNNTTLVTLYLSKNYITDVGAEYFIELFKTNKTLTNLILETYTYTTDKTTKKDKIQIYEDNTEFGFPNESNTNNTNTGFGFPNESNTINTKLKKNK